MAKKTRKADKPAGGVKRKRPRAIPELVEEFDALSARMDYLMRDPSCVALPPRQMTIEVPEWMVVFLAWLDNVEAWHGKGVARVSAADIDPDQPENFEGALCRLRHVAMIGVSLEDTWMRTHRHGLLFPPRPTDVC